MIFDQKKANHAIRFIETFCRHNKGALAPGHLKLQLWQRAMISVIFGIVDPDGCRHFREVFVTEGRKMGKTLQAAAEHEAKVDEYMDGLADQATALNAKLAEVDAAVGEAIHDLTDEAEDAEA